jgi:hypothetical protein
MDPTTARPAYIDQDGDVWYDTGDALSSGYYKGTWTCQDWPLASVERKYGPLKPVSNVTTT